jgi:hypothetical protein
MSVPNIKSLRQYPKRSFLKRIGLELCAIVGHTWGPKYRTGTEDDGAYNRYCMVCDATDSGWDDHRW